MCPTTDSRSGETPVELQAIGRGAITIMTVPERNWKQRRRSLGEELRNNRLPPKLGKAQVIFLLTIYRRLSMLTFVCIGR